MLNSIQCLQQSTSSPGSRSEGLMGLRGLFGEIDPFERVERNMESAVATTLRLNLDWIASRTMTRLRQVSIPFLAGPWQESLLQHAAELTFMLTPDNIRG